MIKNLCLSALLFIVFVQTYAQLQTNISVHDPVIIRQDSTYYIFCTGQGISEWSSADMQNWKKENPVFAQSPQWVLDALPGFKDFMWAPDISYHNGMYYLYYAASAFGKNTSVIGLATNKTLNTSSKNYHWKDEGKIIQSVPNRDLWNAIDPNEADDEKGNHWLVFGSFWNGIKLVKLTEDLKSVAQPEQWFTVAARPRNSVLPDSVAGDGAIEAPFIFKKDNYYYLFVSFDYCCRGEKSTYKIMVGKSDEIEGPYADKDGVPMNLGGGSLVAEGNKNWYGAGHNAVVTFNGIDYIVYHGYDASDNGKPKLRIEKLNWVNGWPTLQKQPF